MTEGPPYTNTAQRTSGEDNDSDAFVGFGHEDPGWQKGHSAQTPKRIERINEMVALLEARLTELEVGAEWTGFGSESDADAALRAHVIEEGKVLKDVLAQYAFGQQGDVEHNALLARIASFDDSYRALKESFARYQRSFSRESVSDETGRHISQVETPSPGTASPEVQPSVPQESVPAVTDGHELSGEEVARSVEEMLAHVEELQKNTQVSLEVIAPDLAKRLKDDAHMVLDYLKSREEIRERYVSERADEAVENVMRGLDKKIAHKTEKLRETIVLCEKTIKDHAETIPVPDIEITDMQAYRRSWERALIDAFRREREATIPEEKEKAHDALLQIKLAAQQKISAALEEMHKIRAPKQDDADESRKYRAYCNSKEEQIAVLRYIEKAVDDENRYRDLKKIEASLPESAGSDLRTKAVDDIAAIVKAVKGSGIDGVDAANKIALLRDAVAHDVRRSRFEKNASNGTYNTLLEAIPPIPGVRVALAKALGIPLPPGTLDEVPSTAFAKQVIEFEERRQRRKETIANLEQSNKTYQEAVRARLVEDNEKGVLPRLWKYGIRGIMRQRSKEALGLVAAKDEELSPDVLKAHEERRRIRQEYVGAVGQTLKETVDSRMDNFVRGFEGRSEDEKRNILQERLGVPPEHLLQMKSEDMISLYREKMKEKFNKNVTAQVFKRHVLGELKKDQEFAEAIRKEVWSTQKAGAFTKALDWYKNRSNETRRVISVGVSATTGATIGVVTGGLAFAALFGLRSAAGTVGGIAAGSVVGEWVYRRHRRWWEHEGEKQKRALEKQGNDSFALTAEGLKVSTDAYVNASRLKKETDAKAKRRAALFAAAAGFVVGGGVRSTAELVLTAAPSATTPQAPPESLPDVQFGDLSPPEGPPPYSINPDLFPRVEVAPVAPFQPPSFESTPPSALSPSEGFDGGQKIQPRGTPGFVENPLKNPIHPNKPIDAPSTATPTPSIEVFRPLRPEALSFNVVAGDTVWGLVDRQWASALQLSGAQRTAFVSAIVNELRALPQEELARMGFESPRTGGPITIDMLYPGNRLDLSALQERGIVARALASAQEVSQRPRVSSGSLPTPPDMPPPPEAVAPPRPPTFWERAGATRERFPSFEYNNSLNNSNALSAKEGIEPAENLVVRASSAVPTSPELLVRQGFSALPEVSSVPEATPPSEAVRPPRLSPEHFTFTVRPNDSVWRLLENNVADRIGLSAEEKNRFLASLNSYLQSASQEELQVMGFPVDARTGTRSANFIVPGNTIDLQRLIDNGVFERALEAARPRGAAPPSAAGFSPDVARVELSPEPVEFHLQPAPSAAGLSSAAQPDIGVEAVASAAFSAARSVAEHSTPEVAFVSGVEFSQEQFAQLIESRLVQDLDKQFGTKDVRAHSFEKIADLPGGMVALQDVHAITRAPGGGFTVVSYLDKYAAHEALLPNADAALHHRVIKGILAIAQERRVNPILVWENLVAEKAKDAGTITVREYVMALEREAIVQARSSAKALAS